MRLACCADPLSWPTAAGTGLEGVEGHVQALLTPGMPDGEIAPRLTAAKALPLPIPAVNCFLPASLRVVGPQADHDAIATWADIAFARASLIGANIVVFGSGGARSLSAGTDRTTATSQLIDLLHRLAPVARGHGIVLALEPLNPGECNLIRNLGEGAAVVRAVQRPQVRLLVDLYHALRSGDTPEDLAGCADLVVHVHVAEPRHRGLPGAADDFIPWFRVLRAVGYDGWISCEGGMPGGDARDPAVAEATRFLREQWLAADPRTVHAVARG